MAQILRKLPKSSERVAVWSSSRQGYPTRKLFTEPLKNSYEGFIKMTFATIPTPLPFPNPGDPGSPPDLPTPSPQPEPGPNPQPIPPMG